MTMTPAEYVDIVCKAAAAGDWDPLQPLLREACQGFAERREWAELVLFFAQTMHAGTSAERRGQVHACLGGLSDFKSELAAAFAVVAERVAGDPGIKAIYFEYFFDGAEATNGNFFLCTRHSTSDDSDWASDSPSDGVVPGPGVASLLNFDPESDWDETVRFLANGYVHACFLAALGELLDKTGFRSIPVGFAQHDGLTVHLMPPTD